MERRTIPVTICMVEPTTADCVRDFQAIGGLPKRDVQPLLFDRYDHFSLEEQIASLDVAQKKTGHHSLAQTQRSSSDSSPLEIVVPGTSSTKDLDSLPRDITVKEEASTENPRGQKRAREEDLQGERESAPDHCRQHESDSLSELSVACMANSRIQHIFNRIKHDADSRFDRRFVEFQTLKDQQFKAAVKLVQGDSTHPSVFQKYLQATRGSNQAEAARNLPDDTTSLILAAAFDDIADALQPGTKAMGYFSSRAKESPLCNPQLNFVQEHGEEGDHDQWYGAAPNMVIWKRQRLQLEIQEDMRYDWGEFAAVGDVHLDKKSDMRTTGLLSQATLAKVLTHMVSLSVTAFPRHALILAVLKEHPRIRKPCDGFD